MAVEAMIPGKHAQSLDGPVARRAPRGILLVCFGVDGQCVAVSVVGHGRKFLSGSLSLERVRRRAVRSVMVRTAQRAPRVGLELGGADRPDAGGDAVGIGQRRTAA